MEEIHTGKRPGSEVSETNTHQGVVLVIEKLTGKGPFPTYIPPEVGQGGDPVSRPAPAPLHIGVVGIIQLHMFVRNRWRLHDDVNIAIALQGPPLAA
jgi:hypothetical protein